MKSFAFFVQIPEFGVEWSSTHFRRISVRRKFIDFAITIRKSVVGTFFKERLLARSISGIFCFQGTWNRSRYDVSNPTVFSGMRSMCLEQSDGKRSHHPLSQGVALCRTVCLTCLKPSFPCAYVVQFWESVAIGSSNTKHFSANTNRKQFRNGVMTDLLR